MREKEGMSKGKQSVEEFEEKEVELRRGPWTLEEDTQLIHYIAHHGEGQWNMLAKSSGLKRTGKSCRLRWLNYLKPDVKRGNLTPQEQQLILHLHSKWGNRWSKIALHLPGRTDNEIKNYWRTRVQKHARQLNIESNSENFVDPIRLLWVPRLKQKMEQTISSSIFSSSSSSSSTAISATPYPPLSSYSQSILTNSENPCSETSESADFSPDYSKISLLCQNEEHPSIFMLNEMNLNNSIPNNNCYEANENNYSMWDFNLGNSPALEMHDMSDIDSHLAEPESTWDMLDPLWNIDIV